MLLAIDVGNSNMVMGLYRLANETLRLKLAVELVANWRITTPARQTVDEFGVLLRSLFAQRGFGIEAVSGVAISSVVPPLDSMLRQVCELYFHVKPLFIEPGVQAPACLC